MTCPKLLHWKGAICCQNQNTLTVLIPKSDCFTITSQYCSDCCCPDSLHCFVISSIVLIKHDSMLHSTLLLWNLIGVCLTLYGLPLALLCRMQCHVISDLVITRLDWTFYKSDVKRRITLGHLDQNMAQHGCIVKQLYCETVWVIILYFHVDLTTMYIDFQWSDTGLIDSLRIHYFIIII